MFPGIYTTFTYTISSNLPAPLNILVPAPLNILVPAPLNILAPAPLNILAPADNMLIGSDNVLTNLNDVYYSTDIEQCFLDFWSWAEKDDVTLKNIEIEMTCSVCMINKKAAVFVDCGHFATCLECSRKMNKKCPLCGLVNEKVIRVYMS